MNERIRQIIDYYGLSIRAFEQKIFVSESLIYRGLARNSDFSASVIAKILNYCPDISPDWLLLGRGDMLRKNNKNAAAQDIERAPIENHGLYINHSDGNNTYNNYAELMHLVTSQQQTIQDLTSTIKNLTTK